MTVNIKRIGGSVAVLIPKQIARELELVEGTAVEITSDDGSVRLRKKNRRPRRSMALLVAQMKTEKKKRSVDHQAIIDDPPVGKEII